MGRITSGVGLISGMDIASIVDQLMALESRPRDLLAKRQAAVDSQRQAVMSVSTQLSSLRSTLQDLRRDNRLGAADSASSDSGIIQPYASNGAAPGVYQFSVGRTVSTQQLLSSGMADASSTALGAGTITFQSAGARLVEDMNLDLLNGQQGVSRGRLRITDRGGSSAVVDLSMAVTIGDVLEAINKAEDINVRASTEGGGIVLTDLTGQAGQSAGDLTVSQVNQGSTAADLGLLGSVAGSTLTGSNLVSVNADTALSLLNNGLGVETSSGQDLRIVLRDGTAFGVDLSGLSTLGQVAEAINSAPGNPGSLVAGINSAGRGIQLTNLSAGGLGGTFMVTSGNGGRAAADLGILGGRGDSDGLLAGRALLGGLQEVLLSRLNGGRGVDRGSISITDRSGAGGVIDLSSADTVQDVIAAINSADLAAKVRASISAAGNGIVITDTSGGSGNLVIADSGGRTMAADLGLTVDAAVSRVAGGDLNRQLVGLNTLLADLGGGRGVTRGEFEITDSAGLSATVDLAAGDQVTLRDVVAEINSRPVGVTARINDTGDGLLLEDTAGGSVRLEVKDLAGSAASDLNIAGTSAEGATYIDGSSKVTITVAAGDTLEDLAGRINSSGLGLRAGILNDSSPLAPYRLSLSSEVPGAAGAWLVDAGQMGLTFSEIIRGRDAVLSVGDGGLGEPVLITSSSNSVSGVIEKVTLDLVGADPGRPVTVTISRNVEATASSLKDFVDQFNAATAKIRELTAFDTETMSGAILQGDGTMLSVERQLYSIIFRRFEQVEGSHQRLSSIGFRIGAGGQLSLDEDRFTEVFTNHAEDVRALLADLEDGAFMAIENLLGSLTAPVTGRLTLQAGRLQNQSGLLQNRIDTLNNLLAGKRERLTRNFMAMEEALATLQGQQGAITSLASAAASWRQALGNRGSQNR